MRKEGELDLFDLVIEVEEIVNHPTLNVVRSQSEREVIKSANQELCLRSVSLSLKESRFFRSPHTTYGNYIQISAMSTASSLHYSRMLKTLRKSPLVIQYQSIPLQSQ